MSTPIRVSSINGASCPQDTDTCHYDIHHFDVTVQKNDSGSAKPYFVQTWGLEEGDDLIIERVKKENCDPMFAPLYCGGQAMGLSETYPATVLTMPGTYRFRKQSNKPLNWDDDFAVEMCGVHPEYAQLWLQQQCCCKESKE